ncbi:F-box domain-containing protein [Haematococcus lacustris]|uniref:F-box domain-containing protein n=1 Tax=Haematococcus lacustris TaxID=44745 RepID=A0A699YD60_HAELA|nr:F-box domain-containing protein [Haematococcus lacustris]
MLVLKLHKRHKAVQDIVTCSLFVGCSFPKLITAGPCLSKYSMRLKRSRQASCDDTCLTESPPSNLKLCLETLTDDILGHIMDGCNSVDLLHLRATCKRFRQLTEEQARIVLLRKSGGKEDYARRWGRPNWLASLCIEEALAPFDQRRAERDGFEHDEAVRGCNCQGLQLPCLGPKLLVSEQSTSSCRLLRWRMQLTGSTAVEFGVVPEELQDRPKALHKGREDTAAEQAARSANPAQPSMQSAGICSSITVGSKLPLSVPLMSGSIVEMLASASKLSFIITQPCDSMEPSWQLPSTNIVYRQYRGPKTIRLSMDLHMHGPLKLAVTCWHGASFKVLDIGPSRQGPVTACRPPHLSQALPPVMGPLGSVAVTASANNTLQPDLLMPLPMAVQPEGPQAARASPELAAQQLAPPGAQAQLAAEENLALMSSTAAESPQGL